MELPPQAVEAAKRTPIDDVPRIDLGFAASDDGPPFRIVLSDTRRSELLPLFVAVRPFGPFVAAP